MMSYDFEIYLAAQIRALSSFVTMIGPLVVGIVPWKSTADNRRDCFV
jgi:hypothetical protein